MSKTINRSVINFGGSGTTLLTITFVLLKAFDKIDWSWWWVFAPMWGPLAIIIGMLVVALVGLGIGLLIAGLVAFFAR